MSKNLWIRTTGANVSLITLATKPVLAHGMLLLMHGVPIEVDGAVNKTKIRINSLVLIVMYIKRSLCVNSAAV